MRKLILLFVLLSGISFGQEKDIKNRYLVNEISKIGLPNSEQRDLMVHMLDSISTTTSDLELKKDISKKVFNLTEINFVDSQAVDLSTLDKTERKPWDIKHDKFKEITYIKSKNYSGSRFYPYIGVKDNGYMYMRLKASFNSSAWVFVEKIIFLIDGEKIEFNPVSQNRDVSLNARVQETFDTPVDAHIYTLLQKIANSTNDIEYRLQGKRTVDFKLKPKEKQIIKETLELYDRLKK